MHMRAAKDQASGNDAPIRILIADRKAHFRETVRRVLDLYSNCEVTGEAASLPEAMAKIAEARPDLVLLDLSLVASPGLTRLRRLAQNYPWLRIVVLLTEYSPDYETAIQSLGQYPCVAKDRLEEHLPWAISGLDPGQVVDLPTSEPQPRGCQAKPHREIRNLPH